MGLIDEATHRHLDLQARKPPQLPHHSLFFLFFFKVPNPHGDATRSGSTTAPQHLMKGPARCHRERHEERPVSPRVHAALDNTRAPPRSPPPAYSCMTTQLLPPAASIGPMATLSCVAADRCLRLAAAAATHESVATWCSARMCTPCMCTPCMHAAGNGRQWAIVRRGPRGACAHHGAADPVRRRLIRTSTRSR